MLRRRKKLALATPNEITAAIYSLTTRGKHARSHIKEELLQIINAAKAQLADYQKGLENHRRHKYRNPAWPSTQRSNEWFRTHRREAIDEPKQVTSGQRGEQEAPEMTLAQYEESIRQPIVPKTPAQPPAKTQAQLDFEANVAMCAEQDREREAKRLGVNVDDLD
jgi:hypothetical protein